jgi:hypothetical protein
MRKSLIVLALVVSATGCGGFGGGHGGGSSTAAISSGNPIGTSPVTSGATWLPKNVTRSTGYTFNVAYQPNAAAGGSISASTVAPIGTDLFLGISPLGRVDHLTATGPMIETSFVFDVSSFAINGTDLFAATSNPIATNAGCVYQRDPSSGTWLLSLNGSQKQCVPIAMAGTVYAFQGENDGLPGTVSMLTSGSTSWVNVATIGSMVPASAVVFNNELFVGGSFNSSAGGPAVLQHGNGTTFASVSVPGIVNMGQSASISCMVVANNTLFVGLELTDVASGATLGGDLFYLDAKDTLQSVSQMQNDAPISMVAQDGTIYAGTRAGKLEWLDETGKWNVEAGLPTNLGVTTLVSDGDLFVGVRGQQGAQLLDRVPGGPGSSTGITFSSITPSSGAVAGGTAVTIVGTGFGNVNMVSLGGNALTGLVVTNTQITGTTSAGTAGAVDVKIVSSTLGTLDTPGAFTYGTTVVKTLSYATDILPLLNDPSHAASDRCLFCHSATGSYPAVQLGTYAGMSPEVTPGNVATSRLAQYTDATVGNGLMAVHTDPAMVTTFETWITQGAKP